MRSCQNQLWAEEVDMLGRGVKCRCFEQNWWMKLRCEMWRCDRKVELKLEVVIGVMDGSEDINEDIFYL